MKLLLAVIGVLTSMGLVSAQSFFDLDGQGGSQDGFTQQAPSQNDSLVPGPGSTYLGPIRLNTYGPAINADATGRAF